MRARQGESLASTSDIVTDAMTAFGLAADGNSKVLKDGYEVEVSNAQRFTDVLAAASNNANTNVSMLGETFKYVAPVAGAMGYSVEDVAIAAGLMANNGIKAGMAGTALRNVLTNMANPTDTMAAAMDMLGISLEDGEGDMYSLLEVLEQLRAGFSGGKIDSEEFAASLSEIEEAFESGELSEEEYEAALNDLAVAMYGAEGAQKAQLAAMLAGKYGMAGLLAIVNTTDEDFQSLTESIYNSNGATEEMYVIMTDNAQGAVTMLDSAINVLYTSLAQHIIPIFTEVVRKITEVVNWFGSLDEGTQKVILTIGGIAVAVGPVLTVIGNIITAVSAIIPVVQGVGAAVSGLFTILAANPIGLVIAAVAALVAGLVVLWNTNEDFRNAVGAIWEAIKSAFVSAWDAVKAAWDGAAEFFSGIGEGIRAAFEGIGEFFGNLFSAAWDAVQSAWDGAVDFFSGIADGIQSTFEAAAGFLSDVFSAAWEAVQAAWNTAVSFFSGVWSGISAAFSGVADFFGGVFSQAWEAMTSVWDSVTDFFSGVWENIKNVFSDALNIFKNIGSNIVSGLKNGITGAWSGLTSWFSGLFDGLVSGVKNKLAIHSPSGVFAGIGENMALGLEVGWDGQYSGIKRQIERGLDFGTASVSLAAGMASYDTGNGGYDALSASRGGDTYNFYSPTALDPVSAAREMKKAKQQMALGYVGG